MCKNTKNALNAVLAIRAHELTELALHIAALVMFFHTAEYAPQEQHPNAEAYSIQQHRSFGIQSAQYPASINNDKNQMQKNIGFGQG